MTLGPKKPKFWAKIVQKDRFSAPMAPKIVKIWYFHEKFDFFAIFSQIVHQKCNISVNFDRYLQNFDGSKRPIFKNLKVRKDQTSSLSYVRGHLGFKKSCGSLSLRESSRSESNFSKPNKPPYLG